MWHETIYLHFTGSQEVHSIFPSGSLWHVEPGISHNKKDKLISLKSGA